MIIAKYKFDKSIYEDFIPVFNEEYEYTISDEINENLVTRTIESENLPTQMQFGSSNGFNREKERKSLLEILYLNSNNLKQKSRRQAAAKKKGKLRK